MGQFLSTVAPALGAGMGAGRGRDGGGGAGEESGGGDASSSSSVVELGEPGVHLRACVQNDIERREAPETPVFKEDIWFPTPFGTLVPKGVQKGLPSESCRKVAAMRLLDSVRE